MSCVKMRQVLLAHGEGSYRVPLEAAAVERIQALAEGGNVAAWVRAAVHRHLGLPEGERGNRWRPGSQWNPEALRRIREEAGPSVPRAGAGVAGWIRRVVYKELGLGEPPDPYEGRRGTPRPGNVEPIPGSAIAAARTAAGLTRAQLGEALGVSAHAVLKLEERGARARATVAKLREALPGL